MKVNPRRAGAIVAAAVLGGVLGTAGTASAIVNGTPDTAYPEAGALYLSSSPAGVRGFACSGVLIDTRVFLTAAHCFAGYVRAHGTLPVAWVTFDQRPAASSTYYGGTIQIDPNYNKTATTNSLYADDVHDFAVVRLNTDPGIRPAVLPSLETESTLSTGEPLTVVGYGTSMTQGGGAPTYPSTGQRESAGLTLQAVTPGWLHESQNPTLGNGGACGGDSGGPNYLAGSHVVLATTITGDMICRSTNVAIRLDTSTARDFLATQIGYPLP